jgi:hypothetical protein
MPRGRKSNATIAAEKRAAEKAAYEALHGRPTTPSLEVRQDKAFDAFMRLVRRREADYSSIFARFADEVKEDAYHAVEWNHSLAERAGKARMLSQVIQLVLYGQRIIDIYTKPSSKKHLDEIKQMLDKQSEEILYMSLNNNDVVLKVAKIQMAMELSRELEFSNYYEFTDPATANQVSVADHTWKFSDDDLDGNEFAYMRCKRAVSLALAA